MRTFAETQGEAPFDWNAFLNKERITKEEWEQVEDLAFNWVTCACGNQCDKIPRFLSSSKPSDIILAQLGVSFAAAIEAKNKPKAKKILQQIEERSAFLLKCIEAVERLRKAQDLVMLNDNVIARDEIEKSIKLIEQLC